MMVQTSHNNILITGATGNVGEAVIAAFPHRERLRIGVRKPEKARQQLGDDLTYVAFDFVDPTTYQAALTGVTRLFLIRPPAISNVEEHIAPVIKAAATAGVQQIVFLSLQGVENNSIVPHYKIEKHLEASGIAWTFLRAGFFMQNLSTTHFKDIRDNNEIFIPAGKAKTSFIDVRDIAEVAVKTLSETGHENTAYTLTGDTALDYYEVAEIFTDVLKRPISYTNPSIPRFMWRMVTKHGQPLMYTIIMVFLYTNTRRGMAAEVSPTIKNLLGKPARTMQQFITDYADIWR